MSNGVKTFVFVFAAAAAAASPALTEEMLSQRAIFDDWAVFVDDAAPNKYCYAATLPKESTMSRNARRGDVFLMISTFPSANVANELSVRVGYPIDQSKRPQLNIGGSRYGLISEGEEAWLENPEQDQEVVRAMKRGATAVVTATSERGTRTTDEFSLIGFTAAVNHVAGLCK